MNLKLNTINETTVFLIKNSKTGKIWDGFGFNGDINSPKCKPEYVNDTKRMVIEYTYENVISIPCNRVM